MLHSSQMQFLLKIWRKRSAEGTAFAKNAASQSAGAETQEEAQEIKDEEGAPQDKGHTFGGERDY